MLPVIAKVGTSILGVAPKLGKLKTEVAKIGDKREYIKDFVRRRGSEKAQNLLDTNGVTTTGGLEILDERKKPVTNAEEILGNEEELMGAGGATAAPAAPFSHLPGVPNNFKNLNLPTFSSFPQFGGIALLVLIIVFILFTVRKVTTGDGEETTRLNLLLQTTFNRTELEGEKEEIDKNFLKTFGENVADTASDAKDSVVNKVENLTSWLAGYVVDVAN